MSFEHVPLLKRLSWIGNIIYHQAKAVLFVYILNIILVNYDIDTKAAWHMILGPLGFLLFVLEGLVLYTENNVYTLALNRTSRVLIHKILTGIGTTLITIGVALMISAKNEHFTTSHGVVGLILLIFIWITVILGMVVSQSSRITFVSPIWLKFTHFTLGVCVVTLGMTTIGLGMYKGSFLLFSNESTVIAGICVGSILAVWALYDTAKSFYYLFA